MKRNVSQFGESQVENRYQNSESPSYQRKGDRNVAYEDYEVHLTYALRFDSSHLQG